MAIWHDGKKLRCNFYEAGPARVTEFEVSAEGKRLEFRPRGAGGAALAFERQEDGSFTYSYSAKGPDGKELTAKGRSRRSKDDYPDIRGVKPGEALSKLSHACGSFEGSGRQTAGDLKREYKEKQRTRAILGGEMLEMTHENIDEGGRHPSRAFIWRDGGTWRVHAYGTGEMFLSLEGAAGDNVLELRDPAAPEGMTMTVRMAWTADGYDWRITMTERGQKIESRSEGRRVK